MALAAVVVALTIPSTPDPPTAIAAPPPPPPRCHSRRCERRIGHRRTLERWRRTTQPYRTWLRSTRLCESGGRYGIATGNGFYGAYQFTISSWYAAGGRGMPHHAEPLEQDYRAVRLLWLQGRGAWPVCG